MLIPGLADKGSGLCASEQMFPSFTVTEPTASWWNQLPTPPHLFPHPGSHGRARLRQRALYLGDVCFDAFSQLDALFSEELGQLVWDVLVFIQSIQETQTLELLIDALAAHL